MKAIETLDDQLNYMLDFLAGATPLELAEVIRFTKAMPPRGVDLTQKGRETPIRRRHGIKRPPSAPALLVYNKNNKYYIEVNRAAMKCHHGPVKGDMGFSMVIYDEGDRRLLAVELGGGVSFYDRRGSISAHSAGLVGALTKEIEPVVGKFKRCAVPLEDYRGGRWVFNVNRTLIIE